MMRLTRLSCLLAASLLAISLAPPDATQARQSVRREGPSGRRAAPRPSGKKARGWASPAAPTLGDYPDTSVQLSANMRVAPDAPPSGATRVSVQTSTDFKGRLEVQPATGVVRVTNAHPAGAHAVTVRAFDAGGAETTKLFTLTVTTPSTCNPVAFSAPNFFMTQNVPDSVAVGDFNSDGNQDLAVVNRDSNTVSILLGNGSGGFTAPSPGAFGVGLAPRSVAVGDFDGDGDEDLAVANQSSNHVSILLGNGAGGFVSGTPVSIGSGSFGAAVGDFDRDGDHDLAVTRGSVPPNNVVILSGDGLGGFVVAGQHSADVQSNFLTVGDFNRDGDHDLAVTNLAGIDVTVLVGTAGLGFDGPNNFGSGGDAESVAVGNFNSNVDQDQDLAVAFFNSSNNVMVWLGGAGASFSGPTVSSAGDHPLEVAVGDFDGDGKQDLVTANQDSHDVSILSGDGNGGFGPADNFAAGINPRTLAVGDFNGDGLQDVVTTNFNSSTVSVLLRQCTARRGELLISEFRLSGPQGPNDEFVELYNNTDAPHTVRAADGSAGYAVAAQDGQVRCIIPNDTVIPARGHFLCVNSAGYSLFNYPAGVGTTATGDPIILPGGIAANGYATDIPDNHGLALFNVAADISTATPLDAVGFATSPPSPAPYIEGAGLPPLSPLSTDYSFVRDECGKAGSIMTFGVCPSGGRVVDADNNAKDFFFVDTFAADAGAGRRLGAPGPQNLRSPVTRHAGFATTLLSSCATAAAPPNRIRDFTSDPASCRTFGTLSVRRTITNHTGSPVTRLRFRVVDITTFPVPSGIADLRPQTGPDLLVAVGCGPTGSIEVRGTVLEQPPSQPNCGGFNSSLSVQLDPPLDVGDSVSVHFLLGIQQTGSFKFYINIEALP
jgi:hypothetical protein